MSGLQIQTGGAANELSIDNTALRASISDRSGNPVSQSNASQITTAQQGLPIIGRDWRVNRSARLLSDGSLAGQAQILFADNMEGIAANTNKWLQTLTTHTITASGGALLFNASSVLTATTGALSTSLSKFAIPARGRLVARSRQNLSAHQNGHVFEMGFGSPTSATLPNAVGDGAFWQKDSSGSWNCIISTGNSLYPITANLSDAAFNAAIGGATQNFWLEVDIGHEDAIFRLLRHDGTIGAEFSDTVSGNGTAGFTGFQSHKLGFFVKELNQSAVATAVQVRLGAVSVTAVDSGLLITQHQQAAFDGRGAYQLAVNGFGTAANYAKDTLPTVRTLVGTAPGESSFGGRLSANAMAGGATDLLMYGVQNLSNYTFMWQGLVIPPPLNQVAAVMTAQTTLEYFIAVNSSSSSLAAGSPKFVALPGQHIGAIALAAGSPFAGQNIGFEDAEGIAIQPGRFLQIGLRAITGAATATETFLWNTFVKGKYI